MMLLQSKKLSYFVFLLLLVGGGYYFISSSPQSASHSLGSVIKQDLLQRVTLAGVVTPFRKTIITAPYNGYVKKIFVRVGDQVKAGDPIVSINQSLQSAENAFPLRAPFDGVIVQIDKSEGEYVKEGDAKEFILRIDDLSKLYIMANTPEIDRVKVKVGQEAIIKASAILNRSYKGVIRELSLAAREKDRWSGSQVVEFPIKIEITDADATLKPGMSIIVDIVTDKRSQVLTLRHEYIRREKDQYYVILANGHRQNIKVGLQNEEAFEILAGLKEGDKVKMVDFSELSYED